MILKDNAKEKGAKRESEPCFLELKLVRQKGIEVNKDQISENCKID